MAGRGADMDAMSTAERSWRSLVPVSRDGSGRNVSFHVEHCLWLTEVLCGPVCGSSWTKRCAGLLGQSSWSIAG